MENHFAKNYYMLSDKSCKIAHCLHLFRVFFYNAFKSTLEQQSELIVSTDRFNRVHNITEQNYE